MSSVLYPSVHTEECVCCTWSETVFPHFVKAQYWFLVMPTLSRKPLTFFKNDIHKGRTGRDIGQREMDGGGVEENEKVR